MRLRWLATPFLVLACAGCGGGPGGVAAADCADRVRLDGVIYTGYGSTTRAGTAYKRAEQADCDDVGSDAQGSVFNGKLPDVNALRFHGYPPGQVLGVRFDDKTYLVLFAESVSDSYRDRVYRELAGEER